MCLFMPGLMEGVESHLSVAHGPGGFASLFSGSCDYSPPKQSQDGNCGSYGLYVHL